jgi:branched-subunit amino acid ABC-type transport system permease component
MKRITTIMTTTSTAPAAVTIMRSMSTITTTLDAVTREQVTVTTKLLEGVTGAVLAKIAVLVFIIVFIQKRPQGLFAMKGRSAEA